MCQRRLRREQRNDGLLLLLLAAVLLLFCSSPSGSSGFLRGCEARLLPLLPLNVHSSSGHGRTRDEGGEESSLLRRMLEEDKSPHAHTPIPAPAPAPARSHKNATSSPTHSPTHSDQSGGKKEMNLLWVFIVGPVLFSMFLVVVVIAQIRFFVKRRRRRDGSSWRKGISFHENKQLEKYTFAGLPTISFEELEAACEEFTNVIATSTDFRVFKGTRVSDGLQIAVTRILVPPQKWTARREIGFRHKVEDLARMNHSNMVNLVAYCATDTPFERMLVFEYASNGTLYEHLHSRVAEEHLDWPTRMRIVMGAACGLEYLHHKLVPPTSHFKFDARHVFLTEDYAAKLADFAVSPDTVENMHVKSLGRRKSFNYIATAIGYGDWESYRGHAPNLESDIRSFGVFLLEVVTGRRQYTESQGPLMDWAKEYLHDPEKMWKMVDPSLKDYKKDELQAICDVVQMSSRQGSKLPTMNELADVLSRALRMTREAANRRSSPLLWAEMELLASMEHSLEDVPLGCNSPRYPTSPKHRALNSLGSGNKLNSPFSPRTIRSHDGSLSSSLDNDQFLELTPNSQAPRVSILNPSHSSKRMWASNPAELQLLSPNEQESGSSDDQEAPLAASINSSLPRDHSVGRSFRRVWVENSAEISKLELFSPRGGGRSTRFDSLGR